MCPSQQGLGTFAVLCRAWHTPQLSFAICVLFLLCKICHVPCQAVLEWACSKARALRDKALAVPSCSRALRDSPVGKDCQLQSRIHSKIK